MSCNSRAVGCARWCNDAALAWMLTTAVAATAARVAVAAGSGEADEDSHEDDRIHFVVVR